MTGTVVGVRYSSGKYKKYVIDWTATAGGAFSATFSELGLGKLFGHIHFIETSPGEDGDLTTNLPTASYDLTLKDEYACDVAAGNLADRSGTAAERYVPTVAIPVDDSFTLAGANCGNATQGRVVLSVVGAQ